MRQFRRACRRLTAAQRKCPASFARRVLAAYAEDQFAVRDSRTLIGHDPQCRFVRGGSCDCVPDITLRLPDGSLVDVDQAGRVERVEKLSTRDAAIFVCHST